MMTGAVAFMIFGKDGSRIFCAVNDRSLKNQYDIELFVHCSLDIVDEKASKANEMYLGHLYSDQKYKSFGYISNSSIRMVLVLDLNNMSLKDQEVRGIFKRFHTQYCNAISNPFYRIGDELKSKYLDDVVSQIFVSE